MSGLPWFRMDCNVGGHDKVLALLSDADENRFRAFTSYVCGTGWSVVHETDGLVPPAALPFIHGTAETAKLLVAYGLWEDDGGSGSWRIHNFAKYQPTRMQNAATRRAQSEGGKKGNAKRWGNGERKDTR